MSGRRGDRAQALQVGAILLFALLVVALGIHQAVVVPNENRQVEYDHFQHAQNDVAELRNTVVRAGQQSATLPASVLLGGDYPNRLLSAQPPGFYGSLSTEPLGDVSLENAGGATMTDICGPDSTTTRAATYTPHYEYLTSVSNVTYENTVAYTTGANGGQYVENDQQQLVDGKTVHLYPLVGAYNRSGSDLATMSLHAGTTGENASIPSGAILRVPTRLSAAAWERQLAGEPVTVTGKTDGKVGIEFSDSGTYTVACTPTGAGSAPNNEPRSTAGDSNQINPNFGSDVVLTDVQEPGDATVTLTLTNTNENEYQNLTAMRFAFYSANAQATGNSKTVLPASLTYDGVTVSRVGRYQSLASDVVLAPDPQPGSSTDISVSFDCPDGGTYGMNSGDFFVINGGFDNGKDRTYFVALTNSSTNTRCA